MLLTVEKKIVREYLLIDFYLQGTCDNAYTCQQVIGMMGKVYGPMVDTFHTLP